MVALSFQKYNDFLVKLFENPPFNNMDYNYVIKLDPKLNKRIENYLNCKIQTKLVITGKSIRMLTQLNFINQFKELEFVLKYSEFLEDYSCNQLV